MDDPDPFDELDKLRDAIHDEDKSDTSLKVGSKPRIATTRDHFKLPTFGSDKISPKGWLIIAIALISAFFFIYVPKISTFWKQNASLATATYIIILILTGTIICYIKIILPIQKEAEEKRRKNEEIERRIIRKSLEKKRAKELKILDEEEREYLLNKWVEEEHLLNVWVEREYLEYLKGKKTILSEVGLKQNK